MRALAITATLILAQPAMGQIVFEDARSAFGLSHEYTGGWEHFVGGGVAVFDCNGDDRPDVFAAGGETEARLFVNRPGTPFAFDAGQALPRLTRVTGAYPLDIDGDGILDLAVLRVGPNILLKGQGDCRFSDAGDAWGFASADRWSTAFSATWEAGADWPTLAFGNYVDRKDANGPFEACDVNTLYRPAPAGFRSPAILSPGYCALSMLFSDWQRSGVPELRISNDRHYYVRDGHEQMWTLSPLRERDISDGWDRLKIWGMGIASADLQRDGFPDVMLTSMGDQVLQLNVQGVLAAAGYETGATAHRPHIGDDGRPSTGWHAEFGDVDNDGLPDLFIAKGNVDQMPSNAIRDPNNLLRQRPDGRFEELAASAGVASDARSRGAALADFNLDGLLDIVVVNRRAPMELWLNASPETGHWATVDLRMPGRNQYAVGAWLEIGRADASEWRERTVGGGHVSGSFLPFHIGLGSQEDIRVRAWWPDGTASNWTRVSAGSRVTLQP